MGGILFTSPMKDIIINEEHDDEVIAVSDIFNQLGH